MVADDGLQAMNSLCLRVRMGRLRVHSSLRLNFGEGVWLDGLEPMSSFGLRVRMGG